ncbi:LuxR C-terminal-related transcriptional regulator [Planotetraspora sp. A-T 1434]|uniref:helix-turn-helix transcriptional regulator n=1 Tax=Planotetraspora sp. A-T 1434 TaxID=2979219 RepID=UPI0021BE914E|nr:LuxR family transcriptional regulator [Planotetraspora sp. A-T 1434]MCT9930766.1 LuxR C-terminal-related transcriptional regulator [Planotetraspora sp. A-T 1434]
MLEVAGLSPVEERTYRFLVSAVEADVADVSAYLGLQPAQVEETLRSMRRKGLVREVSLEGRRFAPVTPEIALGASLLRQRQALDWARRAVDQLSEEFRGNARRNDARELVEVVPDRAGIREQIVHLQDNARDEVLYFCRTGPVVMTADENEEPELAALRRGVTYRVIYERALLEEAGMQANVAFGIKLGELARAVPSLPVRMTVVDRKIGLLTLVQDAGPSEPTAALIRDSTLLDALLALFENYWERATPLRVLDDGGISVESVPCPLDSPDLYLLSLLVAGVPDKSIASQLGISQRTVQRRVSHIMEAAGAQTRMQLAWHAARERWL